MSSGALSPLPVARYVISGSYNALVSTEVTWTAVPASTQILSEGPGRLAIIVEQADPWTIYYTYTGANSSGYALYTPSSPAWYVQLNAASYSNGYRFYLSSTDDSSGAIVGAASPSSTYGYAYVAPDSFAID